MYRTDKQFMKNPATASQRIYIGGLHSTVVADDLEQKFRQHGKILGLVLQRGFAFIQYETDDEARTAIRIEQGAIFHGKKLVVKNALPERNRGNVNPTNTNVKPPNVNTKPSEQNTHQKPTVNTNVGNTSNAKQKPTVNANVGNTSNAKQKPTGNPNVGNTSVTKQVEPQEAAKPKPASERECESPPHIEEQDMDTSEEKFHDGNEPNEEFPPKPLSIVSSENFDEEDSRVVRKRLRPGKRQRRNEDRFPPHPPPMERDRFRGPGQFYPPQDRYPEFEKPPLLMDRPERNDCEIIVVSKMLTEYAEFIESRLKGLGLIVDLLFPNEDVPIGRVLANISSRGCLYAILIMPQNKENESLTLNVLHGIPQEHRNMPLEDALLFMSRNFEGYMRGENASNSENVNQMAIYDKHPNSMQLLLNMLSENRLLTSVQYDKLLKYLEERRELQVQFEVSEGIEVSSENSVTKQAELQTRIMNILNKSSDNSGKLEVEQVPPPPSTAPGPTPLLKDPTVQKALDSLLLGDMFKNIATG